MRAQERTAATATPSNPTTLVVDEPPPTSATTLVDEPLQRPPIPGSDNSKSPSGTLLRGFYAVRDQASKPDTSAGQVAVSAIPGPKPVSTSAILVALLFCQGERATGAW